jgi:hypothetical protein
MTEQNQEKQWKADARQLKEDLDNRQKIIQKREIPLSFGGTKKVSLPNAPKPTKTDDDWARKQLGL